MIKRQGVRVLICLTLLISSGLIAYKLSNHNKINSEPTNIDSDNTLLDEQLIRSSTEVIQNNENNIVEKLDSTLSNWVITGEKPSHLNSINGKTSIMFFTRGDPTLNGMIDPIGVFSMGNLGINYVHTAIDSIDVLDQLIEDPYVSRVMADYSSVTNDIKNDLEFNPYQELENRVNRPSDYDLPVVDSFQTRELIGANEAQTTYGYDGSGVVVNVHDTGVDYGHPALSSTLAKQSDGTSATFDGTGNYFALTNLWNSKYYEQIDPLDPLVTLFNTPLHVNGSGYIDLTGYQALRVFSPTYLDSYTWSTLWETFAGVSVPTTYHVGLGINDPAIGFSFGITWIRTVHSHLMIPFLMTDANDDGNYDEVYFDWQTALLFKDLWEARLDPTDFQSSVDYSFADNSAHTELGNPILSSDWLLADGNLGSDGFPEFSIGSFSNTYDVNDWNYNGQNEMINGIMEDGFGYAFMYDYDSHGTSVAGSIAAQDVDYSLYNQHSDSNNLVSIQGVAPGAKILATSGLLTISGDIYNYLWSTGYEPDTSGYWQLNVLDHVANISSNSWGFLSFTGSSVDSAYSFDLYSIFMELLTPVGGMGDINHPGILFVISAGNTGNGYGTTGSPFPPSGVLVGASTESRWRANASDTDPWSNIQGSDEMIGFSSSGPGPTNYPKIDVVNVGAFDYAPIPVYFYHSESYGFNTGSNNSYQLFSGTSQAAPYTSAVLAYIYQAYYAVQGAMIGHDNAKTILKSSAVDLNYDMYRQGSGRASAIRAVQLIHDVQDENSQTVIEVTGQDAMNYEHSRYDYALEYWFGIPDPEIPNLPQPLTPTNDTTLAFGMKSPVDTVVSQKVYSSITSPNVEALSFSSVYSQTSIEMTTANWYNYHFVDDLFTIPVSADFVQFVLTVDQDYFNDSYVNNGDFRIMIGNHVGDDGDGIIEPTERSLLTYGYNTYHAVSITVSTTNLGSNSFIAVRDAMWDPENLWTGSLSPGAPYTISVIAYERTIDLSISTLVVGNEITATLDPTGLSPGFYQGFLVVTDPITGGNALVEYTYSIVLEAKNYATDGWSEISGLRGVAYDNSFFGAVDWDGRKASGDWRYYDIFTNALSAGSLAVEVEWEHSNTVVDAYLVNYNGTIIADSNPVLIVGGKWGSEATSTPNTTRLLADISSYDLSSSDALFTLVLHAVLVDPATKLHENLEIRTAWVSETPSAFEANADFIRSGTNSYNGWLVSSDVAGISWSSAVGNNPIPSFSPGLGHHKLTLANTQSFSLNNYFVPGPLTGSGGAITDPVFQKTFTFEKGTELDITLDWNTGDDLDVMVFPEGVAFSYDNVIDNHQGITLAHPEQINVIIPEDGNYVVLVDFYSGGTSDQIIDLDIFASNQIKDYVSTTSEQTISLLNELPRDQNLTVISEAGGWNGRFTASQDFIFNGYGPETLEYVNIPVDAVGMVSIGKATDIVDFTIDLYQNDVPIASIVGGRSEELIIDSNLITGLIEENFVDYVATDIFGIESSGTLIVMRSDGIYTIFRSRPLSSFSTTVNSLIELEWDIDGIDVYPGTEFGYYNIYVNDEIVIENGNWEAGLLKYQYTPNSAGTYIFDLSIQGVVSSGVRNDTVFVTVVEATSSTSDEPTTTPSDNPTTPPPSEVTSSDANRPSTSVSPSQNPSSSQDPTSSSESDQPGPAFVPFQLFVVVISIPMMAILRKRFKN